MLITTLTQEEIQKQICDAQPYTDLFEFRFDLYSDICKVPSIFTFRRNSALSEEARLNKLWKLAEQQPDYIDIEYDVDLDWIEKFRKNFPRIKIITSRHVDDHTPMDLESIYSEMQRPFPTFYKLVTKATNSIDALRVLSFSKRDPNLSAFCTGVFGEVTRVLGPIFSNQLNYGAAPDFSPVVEGQLSVKEMMETYHFKNLSETSKVFALIGDPLDRSPSHLTHNALFRKIEENAVYVKIPLMKEEMSAFLDFSQTLGFSGASVTMPLKEVAAESSGSRGAVNTLKWEEGKLTSTNSDGVGALDAIESREKVNEKRLLILGAGGTARAIAQEAKKRGAEVLLLNRTHQRAIDLGSELGVEVLPFAGFGRGGYDILVNATSASMYGEMPIAEELLLSERLVMDVVSKPYNTVFLQAAKRKKCEVIYGYELFVKQALKQFQFWLS